jgi:hypothetical protein
LFDFFPWTKGPPLFASLPPSLPFLFYFYFFHYDFTKRVLLGQYFIFGPCMLPCCSFGHTITNTKLNNIFLVILAMGGMGTGWKLGHIHGRDGRSGCDTSSSLHSPMEHLDGTIESSVVPLFFLVHVRFFFFFFFSLHTLLFHPPQILLYPKPPIPEYPHIRYAVL